MKFKYIALAFALATTSSAFAADDTKATDLSPRDVCKKLVDATKASDTKTMEQWMTGGRESKEWAKKGAKMAQKNTQMWQEISKTDCKSETVAGDHAVVVASSEDQERLIPFVKQGGMWKLDTQAYKAFYHGDKRMPASEKHSHGKSSDMPSSEK